MNRYRTRRYHNPRGMALPLVLVCIVLAMALGATLVKAVLLQHRHTQLIDQQHQSLWLAESAVQRALFKLQHSPEYRGETWQIPATTLGGSDDGIVTIDVTPSDVTPSDGDLAGWNIVVEAKYPDDAQHRVLQRRELFVPKTIEAHEPSEEVENES